MLEAQVAPEQWTTLEQTYKDAVKALDPGLVQTFLLHNLKNANTWQIVTVWESREALDAMRNSGQTPRGVLIFRAAGAEPALSVFVVPAHSG
ncbi:MAG: antibiotic biosynthesis monooxygenase [Chloroflexi bacterium]|nr:antibiotic biosynthesis monooxygenase [Chloroflexota bacterium]